MEITDAVSLLGMRLADIGRAFMPGSGYGGLDDTVRDQSCRTRVLGCQGCVSEVNMACCRSTEEVDEWITPMYMLYQTSFHYAYCDCLIQVQIFCT